MHVKECEHMIPQNIYIITPLHGHIRRKEVQSPTTPFPAESPHTMTWEGWFTVLTVNLGSKRSLHEGRWIVCEVPLTRWSMLSSENTTDFHWSDVQSRYFLQNAIRFFRMASMRRGILVARHISIFRF